MTRIMAPVALFLICIQFSLQAQVKPDPSVRQAIPAPTGTISSPPVKKLIPESLICGTFRIDVEEYDKPSKSVDPQLPSGIGRVMFACAPLVLPFPWETLHPVQKTFIVTQAITDSLTQIHLSEALLVNPSARVGDKIQLNLPQRAEPNQLLADRNLLINLIKGLKGPGGLRVRFRDVKWTGPLAPTVLLSEGTAWYPTDPAVPPVPAEIGIEPGFTLSIDSLVITPTRATVRGDVLLPPCIVSANGCTRASVHLPWSVITAQCELYREVPDSAFGPFYVGESGIEIGGRGYIVDFSSVHSDPTVTPPVGNAWKGVVLKSGSTPDPPAEMVTSNRGYLKAKYAFANGLIGSGGLDARLNLASQFAFQTLEPWGYTVVVRPPDGYLKLSACGIQRGQFRGGEIQLPLAAIRDESGAQVRAQYDTLRVQSNMDLFGRVSVVGGFTWGEFSRLTPGRKFYQVGPDITSPSTGGYFYLSASQIPPYYPISGGAFNATWLASPETQLEAEGVQGVTLVQLGRRKFTIWTEDVPPAFPANNTPKLEFDPTSFNAFWMNVIGTGVHTEIHIIKSIGQADEVDLGPTTSTNPRYLGGSALKVSFKSGPNAKARLMTMQFVESATWYSDFNGSLFLNGPVRDTVAFSKLVFTSTANAAGAQLDLSHPLDMKYWGVQVVPKDSTQSAGVICVKLGVVYLTAAGIAEPRHFATPFWLTWGELKASGNLGRLFFDYNGGGQKFDGIPYAPALVKLSDYSAAAPNDSGFVITYGTLGFGFFGSKPLWVYDWKAPRSTIVPFSGRRVRIPASSPYGSGTTDLHLARNWGDGVADLNFDVQYDSVQQNGFVGPGSAAITKFAVFSNPIPGYIDVKAGRSCFSLNHESDLNFNLGPILTSSALGKIWGCGCIVGDNLERIALGGELSANAGAGFSILARSAAAVSVVMGYSPSRTDILLAGDAYAVLLTKNAEVVGFITLTIDRDIGYAEGYAKGLINMDALISGVSGQGEFQWHFGSDNETIQGRVAISMYTMSGTGGGTGAGVESGLWVGINSNKDNVWVMDGISGRFGLNKAALPQYITGFYAYLSYSSSIGADFIFSGGYQTYAGLGAFGGYGAPTGAGFGVIGNVGVYLWGKILGGLASADAWGDLQMIVGLPPAFQGDIGFDVCVAWVLCASETVHGGFNANQGFFLY